MTTEELKAILQKWDKDAKEVIEDDSVGISAEGIVTSHTDIENRAGLSLAGMSIADALAEIEEPDYKQWCQALTFQMSVKCLLSATQREGYGCQEGRKG